jgi:hypothetical protein
MKTMFAALLIASAALVAADAARADVFNTTVDVYNTSGPEFIAGSGVPINGFVQESLPVITPVIPIPNTISVALKPRDRDTGQAQISGNVYKVNAGLSSTFPGVTNLAIDFQFDPGSGPAATNYVLRQWVDFDPTVGANDFAVITLPIFDADGVPDATVDSWSDTDGYFTTNGGGGPWNDATVPYVISNTTRQDFAFWNTLFGKTYDPNAQGEYEYRLEVLDPTGSTLLADVVAFANVVPEPATLALMGVAGAAALAIGRKRSPRS